MKNERSLEVGKRNSNGGSFWKVIGGVALVAAAALVITNLHDIRRYIKISTM